MLLALSRPFLTYCDGCGFALFISGMPTVIVGSTCSVFIMTTTHLRHDQKPQNPFPSFLSVGQVFGFARLHHYHCIFRLDAIRLLYGTRFPDVIVALLIVEIFIPPSHWKTRTTTPTILWNLAC